MKMFPRNPWRWPGVTSTHTRLRMKGRCNGPGCGYDHDAKHVFRCAGCGALACWCMGGAPDERCDTCVVKTHGERFTFVPGVTHRIRFCDKHPRSPVLSCNPPKCEACHRGLPPSSSTFGD